MLKKILESKSRSAEKEKKQLVTMASKSCRNGNVVAFRNIMELAHNICLSPVDRIGNFIAKFINWNGKLNE